MRAILVCAALIAAPAFADELVASEGGDSVRLAALPCTSELVLNHLAPQLRSEFKAATAVVQGKTFAACWRKAGNVAHLLYEDGDQGIIPMADLKPGLEA